MTPIVIKYPLDLTGKSPNNLVLGEIHELPVGVNRAIATNYGPFYTQGLVVRELPSGKVLQPNLQYKAVQLYEEATMRSGLEVCAIIVITDTSVASSVELDYQVVGGEFSSSVYAIQQLIASLDLDSRPVSWGEVLGKPSEFPPTEHLHDIGDLYGFEYVVAALESIRQAILQGDEASHEELRKYADHLAADANARIDALAASLKAHTDNVNNPHQTTKEQVGLGAVDNYATASQTEAESGIVNTRFMTPLRTAQAIAALAIKPLNAHIADKNNPHGVTKAQVGLGSLTNDKQVVNGSGNRIMLQWDGAKLIATVDVTSMGQVFTTSQPDPNLTNHLRNFANPHQVTAAQVGSYTQTQTNNLLAQRLPIGGTAVNSNGFAGRDYQTAYNEIRANIQAELITGGNLNWTRLQNPAHPSLQNVMLTGQGWVDASSFIASRGSSKVYWMGETSQANVEVTFGNDSAYPAGTLVSFRWTNVYSVGTGNGSRTVHDVYNRMTQKIGPNSWIVISDFLVSSS